MTSVISAQATAPSAFVTIISKVVSNAKSLASEATATAAAVGSSVTSYSTTHFSPVNKCMALPETTKIIIYVCVGLFILVLMGLMVLWVMGRSEEKADRRRELELPMRSPVVTFDEGASWTNSSSRTIGGPWERKKSWVYRGDD
ncbi:BZ3500_MvSof-1268-A1-R1_Chr8-1g10026 [Microbotryum saponariae]|uniref:BZ3500_MvSof-1268-A1-R1_Chr8-1g10026 protein n=1 Tax=Microbotryum saponariae TaxID=289078 RepID=A0A2X0KQL9_9BASI|nr:BZ3500_MvSof-1268-A1-R1_Chr8-1g10026 [Microbotryum saponariae]SDA08312.1 BZ3501_MvSof-1269-A2-R1_Chr8-1g09749 [Microbotryum saponariae]